MKLRWKILLVLALATLLAWVYQTADRLQYREFQAGGDKCLGLDIWYRDYNDAYFQNRLPKDTVLNYDMHAEHVMAGTHKLEDGRFEISFNEKYTVAPRVAHMVLLHEMCHVDTWDEKEDHGRRWRTCMVVVEFEGAFRNILIDGYEGQ